MTGVILPPSGNDRSKYDEPVFALAEAQPGEWGIVQQRVRANVSFFKRRYGASGFDFTSRTGETAVLIYGRFNGDSFDRDEFYSSLHPHGRHYTSTSIAKASAEKSRDVA